MDWVRDLPTWPGHEYSRRIRLSPHLWHVQETGQGPTILLLHGAGSSAHSWRGCLNNLSDGHHVVAVDLPGHGFSVCRAVQRFRLESMARDIAALCKSQGWTPSVVIGHSAGAALGLEMARIGAIPRVVGINPALAGFRGAAAIMFPAAAKLLSTVPFMVDTVLRNMATLARIESVLAATGSRITAEDLSLYTRLFRDRDHLLGTVTMMANWSLDPLLEALPTIAVPSLFLCGGRDKAVPPVIALDAADRMPNVRVEVFEDFGHLLQEEAPDLVANWVLDWLAQQDVSAIA